VPAGGTVRYSKDMVTKGDVLLARNLVEVEYDCFGESLGGFGSTKFH
jgi:hypothetical protein